MPAESLPEALCRRLGEFIAQNTGLHFPPERHPDLQRALASAAEELVKKMRPSVHGGGLKSLAMEVSIKRNRQLLGRPSQ